MKYIGLSLCLALFLNPAIVNAAEKPVTKQKTLYKAIIGDLSKITTASIKSGAGLAFTVLGTMALVGMVTATLDQSRGIKSIDTTISFTTHYNSGKPYDSKYDFNAWPLVCGALGITSILNYILAYNTFKSAATDFAAINEESTN